MLLRQVKGQIFQIKTTLFVKKKKKNSRFHSNMTQKRKHTKMEEQNQSCKQQISAQLKPKEIRFDKQQGKEKEQKRRRKQQSRTKFRHTA